MELGYDDSNNVFSNSLGIFNYLLSTVHTLILSVGFFTKVTALAQCAAVTILVQ